MSSVEVLRSAMTKPAQNNSNTLLLQRKCACGGAVGLTGACSECQSKRLRGGAIQTNLRINQPGDEYEQEAELVAEGVTRMPNPTRSTENSHSLPTPQVRRRVAASNGRKTEAAPPMKEVLRAAGEPLDHATRAFMEPRFGHDFSRVRVHTDAKSAESTRAVNALAFTVEQRIHFGAGEYHPESKAGMRLLAHELVHTIQQRGVEVGVKRFFPDGSALEDNSLEHEADHAADEAVAGRFARVVGAARTAAPQRQDKDKKNQPQAPKVVPPVAAIKLDAGDQVNMERLSTE